MKTMRHPIVIFSTAVLVFSVLSAGHLAGSAATMKKMSSNTQVAAMLAHGKAVAEQNRCNGCHGSTYTGRGTFVPSIRQSGALRHYNRTTFERVLHAGLDENGKPLKKQMPIFKNITTANSNALYAFLKSLN